MQHATRMRLVEELMIRPGFQPVLARGELVAVLLYSLRACIGTLFQLVNSVQEENVSIIRLSLWSVYVQSNVSELQHALLLHVAASLTY